MSINPQERAIDPEDSNLGWVTFTRRTEDPKLGWLERQLDQRGIPSRRKGHTWHAPILEVQECDLDRAWAILDPVDDIADDDPQFI